MLSYNKLWWVENGHCNSKIQLQGLLKITSFSHDVGCCLWCGIPKNLEVVSNGVHGTNARQLLTTYIHVNKSKKLHIIGGRIPHHQQI